MRTVRVTVHTLYLLAMLMVKVTIKLALFLLLVAMMTVPFMF